MSFSGGRNKRARSRLSEAGGRKSAQKRMIRKASVGRGFRKGDGRLRKTLFSESDYRLFVKVLSHFLRIILLFTFYPSRPQVPGRALFLMTADERTHRQQVCERGSYVFLQGLKRLTGCKKLFQQFFQIFNLKHILLIAEMTVHLNRLTLINHFLQIFLSYAGNRFFYAFLGAVTVILCRHLF